MRAPNTQRRYLTIPEYWDVTGQITKDSNAREEFAAYNDAYHPDCDCDEPEDYINDSDQEVWHYRLSDFEKYIESLKEE